MFAPVPVIPRCGEAGHTFARAAGSGVSGDRGFVAGSRGTPPEHRGTQLSARLGSSLYRRFSSSWSASSTRSTSVRCAETSPLLAREQLDRSSLGSSSSVGSLMPASSDQTLDPVSGEEHLLLGKGDVHRFAAGRRGLVEARDLRQPIHQRPMIVAPAGRPARPSGSRHGPGRACGARRGTRVRPCIRRGAPGRPRATWNRSLQVRGLADPIDAAVARCSSSTGRCYTRPSCSADGEEHRVRIQAAPPFGWYSKCRWSPTYPITVPVDTEPSGPYEDRWA